MTMEDLISLKRLTVIDIVDNEASDGSSPCGCMKPAKGLSRKTTDDKRMCSYTQEAASALERHGQLRVGDMCTAAHGFSILLIAEYDVQENVLDDTGPRHTTTRKRCLLFDTGPNPSVWKHNSESLHLPLHEIDAIVLSHYHTDHSGGLVSAVPLVAEARSAVAREMYEHGLQHFPPPPLIVDLHPAYISTRGIKSHGKIYPMVPENISPVEIQALVSDGGVNVKLMKMGHTVCDGCFWISGEVPRVTPFEVRSVSLRSAAYFSWHILLESLISCLFLSWPRLVSLGISSVYMMAIGYLIRISLRSVM